MGIKTGGSKELESYMLAMSKQACEYMVEGFYETLNFFLAQYYSEWHPSSYQRGYDLLHSAFKTEVKRVGMGYQAIVGIDYESLDNYKSASGYQVVSWANTKGIHGGLDVSDEGADTAVWDDAYNSAITSGQLIKDCLAFLKVKGINITVF